MTPTDEEISRLSKDQILERIQADPEFQREQAARAQSEFAQSLAKASVPILEELKQIGIDTMSVWHNQTRPDNAAGVVAIYLRHLDEGAYPDRVRAGMATVLAARAAVPEVRKEWARVKAIYERETGPEAKDALASTLASSASKSTIDDLIEILALPQRRESALFFLSPILRWGGEHGKAVVESLQNDSQLGKEARALLKKRSKRARAT